MEKNTLMDLPIVSKPEWMDIDLGEGYSVTFQFIGDRILHSMPKGNAGRKGMEHFLRERTKVLDAMLAPREPFFELKNYGMIQGRPPKSARDRFTKHMIGEQDRIIGFIGYNAALSIRLAINVGKRLFRSPFPMMVVKDYETALKRAMNALIRHGYIDNKISTDQEIYVNDTNNPLIIPSSGEAKGGNVTNHPIQQYVDELLNLLGSINWEMNGVEKETEVDPSHPFKPVFDAISLIKMDVDDLFHERKRIEEALRENEELFRSTFMNAPIGITQTTTEGDFLWVNPKLCEIWGYDPQDLVGLNMKDVIHSEDLPSCFGRMNQLVSKEIEAFSLEKRFIQKDGSIIWGRVNVTQSLGSGSEGLYNIVIIEDITQQKEVESKLILYKDHLEEMVKERTEELTVAKIQAEEASRSKSQFLANMSHEIRTPLNGIIGMTELAMETGQDEVQKEIFDAVSKDAHSLFHIIDNILDFSKIEAGKLEFEEIPFDLRYLLEDIAKSIDYRAAQKGLEFTSFLSPDIPSRLMGDPGRLRQIMINLAGNALKFTKEGEIFLKGEIEKDLGNEIMIRFSVTDTGIGIPKDKLATIFESFVQADGTITRNYGGTGLGTTISKQLAERMGGQIGVESEEYKGSTFWFTVVFRKQIAQKKSQEDEYIVFDKLRVLVVDANTTQRFVLTEYLNALGCQAMEACDGREALAILPEAILSDKPFNLIVTDFQMSDRSGFELVRDIREMKSLKNIPIIMMTPVGNRGAGESFMDVGIDGYLTKPVRLGNLHKTIEMVMGFSRAEGHVADMVMTPPDALSEEQRKAFQILLVEDYMTNQQVAMGHLKNAGYGIDLAENGLEALEKFQERSYDLILMDIQMPEMDGFEATHKIREIESRHLADQTGLPADHGVPIIAMTAHAVKGYKDRCIAEGMDDYISKPLTKVELLTMVDRWIKRKGGAQKHITPRDGIQEKKPTQKPIPPAFIVDSPLSNNDPFDFERAIKEFEGDKDFLSLVIDGFLDKVKIQTTTIRQAIAKGDAELVTKEAHAIKGGASNLTADYLAAIAYELEKIGQSGSLTGGMDILERLENEFYRLEEFAKEYENPNH